jgi:16S rRNA (guanine1207-N2)-methyltransferase
LSIISKPGQFGWNKLDQGSAFLIKALPEILAQHSIAPQGCLDLGCGYGYLTLMASQLPACQAISHWLLTDNNAAAVLSATHNVQINPLNAQVIADDCAANIHHPVDLILCNPPFHQGFSVEGELTERFLAATRKLIAKGGLAVFVINQFIPLEKKASALFRQVETFANNGSFKLVILKS